MGVSFGRLRRSGSDGEGEVYMWPDTRDCAYYYKEKFSRYFHVPRAIALDLNPQCNKKCGKCQFHSPLSTFSRSTARNEKMPLELAFKIMDEVKGWSPRPAISPNYSGEPLLYPHLEAVIEYAKKCDLSISITTNGLLLDEARARSLLRLKIDSLLVSIDASKRRNLP